MMARQRQKQKHVISLTYIIMTQYHSTLNATFLYYATSFSFLFSEKNVKSFLEQILILSCIIRLSSQCIYLKPSLEFLDLMNTMCP